MSPTSTFVDARRELPSLTGAVEKRVLLWLAARTPAWINSDHLTALGLLAMLAAGAAYALAGAQPAWLLAVNALLAVNWLGDSLDGTLARYRGRSRPRYGFYVDHMADMVGALGLLGGLALSGFMSPAVAVAVLVAYYLLNLHIYLATHTQGVFRIAYARLGGTELRILLALGNLVLFFVPAVAVLGRSVLLFDAAGVLAAAGLILTTALAVARTTRALYRLERLD
ncbi:MAG TPA: CDP-alcohol phosphatidyltransferase family protein [Vicinamibacteria bacterium]|jgi:phosphatidylglycerophosphate synthase